MKTAEPYLSFNVSADTKQDLCPSQPGVANGELVLCTVVGVTDAGEAVVRIAGATGESTFFARTLVSVSAEAQGRCGVLQFERGDSHKPILLGLLRNTDEQPATPARLVFAAGQEIVLECGNSSISLMRDGKVLIRGDYVVSRSTGVNRINGASVQIN